MPNWCMPTPCQQCPFRRTDGAVRLTRARVRELTRNSIQGGTFPCHKTVDYSGDDDGRTTSQSRECAGNQIFADKHGVTGQMARIMGRIGAFNPDALGGRDDVFDNEREMLRSSLGSR